MDNKKIDVIVIGAGPAGVSAAIVLARAGKKVLLIERGSKAGSKNVFGGCIYAKQTADIFPEFWKTAPVERSITEEKFILLTDSESADFSYRFSSKASYKAFTVIRSKWDDWCIEQAQKEGVYFAPKTLVKNLLIENGRVTGVETELEKFRAELVIIADGVNSLLAKQAGLRNDFKPQNMTLNVKEVFRLPQTRLEDRFHIDENTGIAAKIFGGPLKDMFAMGFMYTFKDKISIGLGISLDELIKHKLKPHELLDELKEHPSIASYLKEAEFIEYSAHMIPEGSFNNIPKLYDNRVMVTGDAAGFVNNMHFEGTNLAMLSGKLAAETAVFALDKSDLSAYTLSMYYEKLKNSIIIKDLRTHYNTIEVLKKNISTITSMYPEAACSFFDMLTNADGIPKRSKYRSFVSKMLKSGIVQKSIPLGLFAMEKCFRK